MLRHRVSELAALWLRRDFIVARTECATLTPASLAPRDRVVSYPGPPLSEQSTSVDQVRWFEDEVHPHASSLRAYLKGSFPGVRDVEDVVQESFLRIWKARAAHPIQSARAFLFVIARRLAIDHIRHRSRSAADETVTDSHALRVLEDGDDVVKTVSVQEEMAILAEAIDALPARCREIVVLRKLDGLSHREIAQRLGISEETVQVQVGRGMAKCRRFLRLHGLVERAQPSEPEVMR